jgi:hypothetical protein
MKYRDLIDSLNYLSRQASRVDLISNPQSQEEILASFYVEWLVRNKKSDPPEEVINLAAQIYYYHEREKELIHILQSYEVEINSLRNEYLANLHSISADPSHLSTSGTERTVDREESLRGSIEEITKNTKQEIQKSIELIINQCKKARLPLSRKLVKYLKDNNSYDLSVPIFMDELDEYLEDNRTLSGNDGIKKLTTGNTDHS